MINKVFYYLLLILNLFGLLTSLYLTYIHYSSNLYVCLAGDNCNKVLTSQYSQIFGIPISFFGTIYFLIVLILLVLKIKKLIQILIFLGFVVGLILIYLQMFVLKAICFYCFLVDIILLISPVIFTFGKIKL